MTTFEAHSLAVSVITLIVIIFKEVKWKKQPSPEQRYFFIIPIWPPLAAVVLD